ncbi:MAG TPA: hypothetical protein VL049_30060 [Candidatus Dormibacteraeota bacterium]|nr:hypothetical protein [Candidatus Dormibacteraeota bacterium]
MLVGKDHAQGSAQRARRRLSSPSPAAVITVPDDIASVQGALDAAMAGDTVRLRQQATPYHEKIAFPPSGDAVNGPILLTPFPGDPTSRRCVAPSAATGAAPTTDAVVAGPVPAGDAQRRRAGWGVARVFACRDL